MSACLEPRAMAFRPMTLPDLGELMTIETSAYAHSWTEGIFRDCLRVGYGCWVGGWDKVIEAYAVASIAAQESHILNLCVRPRSQGQGYGREMLRHVVEQARTGGAKIAVLEVRPSNRRAIQLYQSFGFTQLGVRKGYYPDQNGREDALIFGLDL